MSRGNFSSGGAVEDASSYPPASPPLCHCGRDKLPALVISAHSARFLSQNFPPSYLARLVFPVRAAILGSAANNHRSRRHHRRLPCCYLEFEPSTTALIVIKRPAQASRKSQWNIGFGDGGGFRTSPRFNRGDRPKAFSPAFRSGAWHSGSTNPSQRNHRAITIGEKLTCTRLKPAAPGKDSTASAGRVPV